jgi:hypothetical protein
MAAIPVSLRGEVHAVLDEIKAELGVGWTTVVHAPQPTTDEE